MQHYATFRPDGYPTAFYNDDVYPPNKDGTLNSGIPANAVVLTQAQYDQFMSNQGQAYWLNNSVTIKPPPAMPALPTVVWKVDLFRRMTDAEYTSMQNSLAAQPARTQAIFNGADTFRSDAPEWAQLQSMTVSLYGSARAAQLLAPSS